MFKITIRRCTLFCFCFGCISGSSDSIFLIYSYSLRWFTSMALTCCCETTLHDMGKIYRLHNKTQQSASSIHNTLQWRHNQRDGVSNHQPHDCLLNRLFRHRSKLCVTGLCEGNSPVTGEFPAQKDCSVENIFIWWRHHDVGCEVIHLSIPSRHAWLNRHW